MPLGQILDKTSLVLRVRISLSPKHAVKHFHVTLVERNGRSLHHLLKLLVPWVVLVHTFNPSIQMQRQEDF